ncbi:hypothetical protein M3C29_005135 [Micrococcus luteus]|nr:hypothetical protein [Micrococcus luteus]
MCRAQGEAGCPHGRRCPPSATAREAALKRRRENRAIGQQIARWAKAEGKADELAELKRQRKPINEIKEWAGQAGAPESVFARAAGPAKKGWEAAKTELRNDPKAPARRAPARGGAPAAAAAGGAGGVGGGGGAGGAGVAGGGGAVGGAGAGAGRDHRTPTPAPGSASTGARGPEWSEWEEQCGEEEAARVALLVERQGRTAEERQLMRMDSAREGAPVAGKGVNDIKRLVWDDGACGYFKPYDELDMDTAEAYGHDGRHQPTHEAAASQFAQALGPKYAALVPPVALVKYEGQWGSISYGVPGGPMRAGANVVHMAEHHSDQASDLAFFDCLIGQVDRHRGNVLMDRRGLSAIDNGFAFTDGVGGVNASMFVAARSQHPQARATTREEKAILARFLDSEDGLGLRGTIEEGRFHEVRRRARLMQSKGRILSLSNLYER